ncbi:hypothetical protein VTI28DRAFT_468 [Corynascus sepedonium]
MRYLCNLNVYITVEAATLIGLTFVAASSYLYRSVMAKKKKSGAPKPPQQLTGSTSTAPKAVTAPKVTDAKGIAQPKPATVAAPVMKEADTRPEKSPYGSPSCTIPFAGPLTVPLDILKKSPKLHAAYELRLPELPAIPEDVGHVLVHYLHTGTYDSLKPKGTDVMSKQICELRTSIQTYAAARKYELPGLMRLAESKIDKYGKGIPLPALLEVARDAYPTLTEGDAWFLNYLRSRIRPHLKDPKSLMGSNLLDQISGILSPNRVLLRTVLELFCEQIVVRPENTTPPAASTIASPITSPSSSRPVSPHPPASSMSLLEMRSRSIVREEYTPARKPGKATPWPSPDNMSEASWARSMSPEPVLPETAPPRFEAKPVAEPNPAVAPFPELGPVILDVIPPPGPSVESRFKDEPEPQPAPEPEVQIVIEPEVKADKPEIKTAKSEGKTAETEVSPIPQPEIGIAIEPEAKLEAEPEAGVSVEREVKGPVEAPTEAPTEATVRAPIEVSSGAPCNVQIELSTDAPVDAKTTIVEPENKAEAISTPALIPQRERKDSGKGIDLEPLPKELDSSLEHVSELGAEPKPQLQVRQTVLREADSGFWEGPDVEPGKESAASIVELEPVVEPAPELAHELECAAIPKNAPLVEVRDFANSKANSKNDSDERADTEVEVTKDAVPESLPTQDAISETAAEVPAKDSEPQTEPKLEPLLAKSADVVPEILADTATKVAEDSHIQELPETPQSKEVEAQPETEKVHEETIEPQEAEKFEPEAETSSPVQIRDDSEPAGSAEAKETQPSVEQEPEPSGKLEVQRANTDSAVDADNRDADTIEPAAPLGTKPTTEQAGVKTEGDAAGAQSCSAQVRQRSWKRRFLSLRYPVLFGRGM